MAIGHLRLVDIRPQHLNMFYEQLLQEGIREDTETAVILPGISLKQLLQGETIGAFCERSEMSRTTFAKADKGGLISGVSARKAAAAFGKDVTELFSIQQDSSPLSSTTARYHHIFIHTVLENAVKEMLIPYNAADRATPPKIAKHKANYFQQDPVNAILNAAENENLKWKALLHLLLCTGGRRGEVCGLKWTDIDWTFNTISIERCAYYEPEHGTYIDIPKNESSVRRIKLPPETMELLKQYRDEYFEPLRIAAGERWCGDGFVFVKDTGKEIGRVINPCCVTGYCRRFSERYGLPHINPHSFRHTCASILYFAGMDSVSISNMLGHAKTSTTANIYSHVITEAQSRAAAAMGEIIMQVRKPLKELGKTEPEDETQTG